MTFTMDPIWKAKWVEALRSGEYDQGKGMLRSKDNKYCCLGVLSDLYAKENPDAEWVDDYLPDSYAFKTPKGGRSSVRTPPSVYEATGVSWNGSLNKEYPYTDEAGSGTTCNLTDVNDAGYTFKEIADIIEENL